MLGSIEIIEVVDMPNSWSRKDSSYAEEVFNAYERLKARSKTSTNSDAAVCLQYSHLSPMKSIDSLEIPSNLGSEEEEVYNEYEKLKSATETIAGFCEVPVCTTPLEIAPIVNLTETSVGTSGETVCAAPFTKIPLMSTTCEIPNSGSEEMIFKTALPSVPLMTTTVETIASSEKLDYTRTLTTVSLPSNTTEEVSNSTRDLAQVHTRYSSASPLKSQDISSNSLRHEDEERFTWTYAATLLLINEYRQRQHRFEDKTTLKKGVWKEVVAVFKKHGYAISVKLLRKKWSNMISTYRKIKDRTIGTGEGSHWKYFCMLDELLDKKTSVPQITYLELPLSSETPSLDTSSSIPPDTTLQSPPQSTTLPSQSCSPPRKRRKRRRDEQTPGWFVEFRKKWREHGKRTLMVQEAQHKERMKKLSMLTQSIQELCRVIKEKKYSM
ncbi:uncharacterized protein LOC111086282 isoform X2 [Limulus polyphemus]|uniref:Uncharacterized protein LOC111086282 isoform X2 n=1 Tax=Limulus polyphemus TaxID=6850 RepID=A0ABM1SKW6_LIMPO|nr:uncharacterized protein LOC111086282 isoform X2 [Limulus polyphemus]